MNLTKWTSVVGCLLAVTASPAQAAGPDAAEVAKVREKAIAFLRKSQATDGGWSARFAGPGITSLATAAMIRNGIGADDPTVKKALEAMEKYVKKDGGVYDTRMANYTTSVAVIGFMEANKGGRYDAVIKNAAAFLRGLQYSEKPDDVKYGGAGYDGKSRPDLSNTQYMLDALLAAGVPKNDPAVERALKFIGRCQNLPGESNELPFAAKTTDDDRGGLTYTPIDPDDSKHKTPAGGLRSLGAMTYAGLKSFLYAGISKTDPRVQGAVKWIGKHYTLAENPGMGQAGVYYYYHTFAKAMEALGDNEFTDADGKKHDWRKELFEALKKRQREDGSFINQGDRTFGEADPNLSTAFALLSLGYCEGKK